MSTVAKKPEGEDFPIIPAGTHHGIFIGVVDLGTQYSAYYDKESQKILLTVEIPKERIIIDGKDLPRVLSRTYTNSLHEKATLRQDLEAVRGVAFTSEDLDGFETQNILGANCLVTVVHVESDGKTYANIKGMAALMKGMEKLVPETPTIGYDIDEDGGKIPQDLPDWIKNMIKKSKEFKKLVEPSDTDDEQSPINTDYDPNVDDGIPF